MQLRIHMNYLFIYLPINLFICLSIYVPNDRPIYLTTYLSTYLIYDLPVYIFLHLFMHIKL